MSAAPRPPRRLLALALAVLAGCTAEPEPERRPDVVLVVVDTLRNDRLSAYGYPRPTSPFLDGLADRGVLFTDVTAQSSWTLPSMVSLFTGRYLTSFRDTIEADAPTLPEVFRQGGYRTVGVAANILLTPKSGFARGFGHYDANAAPGAPGDAHVHARTLEQLAAALWEPLEAALETGADGGRPPLFLYLHPFDPHDPYYHHPQFDDELPQEETVPVQPEGWVAETLAARPRANGGEDLTDAEAAAQLESASRAIQYKRGRYDQEVRYTDAMLERVFARLEQLGVLENAVVAVLSDHGEGLWEHVSLMTPEKLAAAPHQEYLYQKHGWHLYQEAVATPFILSGPGLPTGLRVDAPVENLDLFPTLLELCDLPAPARLDGRSLVALARAGGAAPPDWRDSVHSHVIHGIQIREPATGLKLILPLDLGDGHPREPELYDLPADPHERTDLAADRPNEVLRLRDRIDRWALRYPTESVEGIPVDPEQQARLEALGYTGDHTGR